MPLRGLDVLCIVAEPMTTAGCQRRHDRSQGAAGADGINPIRVARGGFSTRLAETSWQKADDEIRRRGRTAGTVEYRD